MGGNRQCMTLMVVMVSQVYTCPQTHRVIYIKYVQIFTCQSYFNEVLKKKKTTVSQIESPGMEQNLLLHSATTC